MIVFVLLVFFWSSGGVIKGGGGGKKRRVVLEEVVTFWEMDFVQVFNQAANKANGLCCFWYPKCGSLT